MRLDGGGSGYSPSVAIPDIGRLTGQVLLDAVTAWDLGAPPAANVAALRLALQRLDGLQLIPLTYGEDGHPRVEIGHLVGPAIVLLVHAVKLASRDDYSWELVVDELRRVVDQI